MTSSSTRARLLKRVGATRATVLVSVIDAKSRRQHIRAKVTVLAGKR
jgi:predicted house-cleaning NTP pyrophosphatase (Maf/HAM1 superfamily)